MTHNVYPTDLVPLPTSPWDERPASIPLDVEECRTALWLESGNVSNAAKRLKVSPERLRKFTNASARLTEVIHEARQQMVDLAEANIMDALMEAEDYTRRDSMSKFVLTTLGKERGFTTSTSLVVKNKLPTGPIEFSWLEGDIINQDDDGPVIDGEVVK